jgi:ubiquinone/menaquinone biosynthesis C-methylase UbiE
MEHSPSWYDRHVLPYLLDFACGMPPVAAQRRKVIPHAAGRVLEIGVGTGLNLGFYDKAKVTELVAVEPAQQLHRLARRRSERAGLPLKLLALSAERLPLESASFDCVVCTYTLCSVQDPVGALAEMRRVLRPGGTLLFAEHGLAPDASVVRWQHRIEPWWSQLAGGCHLTRDVPLLLREAGFRAEVDTAYIARPKALSFNYWGQAVPSGRSPRDDARE